MKKINLFLVFTCCVLLSCGGSEPEIRDGLQDENIHYEKKLGDDVMTETISFINDRSHRFQLPSGLYFSPELMTVSGPQFYPEIRLDGVNKRLSGDDVEIQYAVDTDKIVKYSCEYFEAEVTGENYNQVKVVIYPDKHCDEIYFGLMTDNIPDDWIEYKATRGIILRYYR